MILVPYGRREGRPSAVDDGATIRGFFYFFAGSLVEAQKMYGAQGGV